jgi:hypothetical protein
LPPTAFRRRLFFVLDGGRLIPGELPCGIEAPAAVPRSDFGPLVQRTPSSAFPETKRQKVLPIFADAPSSIEEVVILLGCHSLREMASRWLAQASHEIQSALQPL